MERVFFKSTKEKRTVNKKLRGDEIVRSPLFVKKHKVYILLT